MNKTTLYAPIAGKCIDISDVNNSTYSSKLLGEGFAIIPKENTVCAPCEGQLILMPSYKHVFGIKDDNGNEVLIHIGLDTAKYRGKGFKVLVPVGTYVKPGDAIITFNKDEFDKDIDLTTIVCIPSKADVALPKQNINQDVVVKTVIMEF